MIERTVEIARAEGAMTTLLFHPEEGGPHPVVLYLMDAPSIRPALRDMASRLATAGYYVMLPYLYYRSEPFREFGASDADMHRRKELMQSLTRARVVDDARALLEHAGGDAHASGGKAGVVGFCMSGPFAVAVAQAVPERIAAAASIHGAWFVTDKPDSTEKNLAGITAELYFAWATDDPTAPAADADKLEVALQEAGVAHRIERYAARHGFAPPGHQAFDRAASERHWERVHALLRRRLG